MKPDIDLSILSEHQREYPWAKLQAWAWANIPQESRAAWEQVMLLRDFHCGGKLKEIELISTHTSKSCTLPVYQIILKNGTKLILRGNFHDWKVTVISEEPVLLNTTLFLAPPDKQILPVYCEGFDPSWVLAPYSESKKTFTFEVPDNEYLFAVLMQIVHPDPFLMETLASLQRTVDRFERVLASQPVRDADETLSEARQILKSIS